MSPTSVDEFLTQQGTEARTRLEEIRSLVKQLVPEAVEVLSYGVPSFRLKRVFIHYAVFKEHLGIYPPVDGDAALMAELKPHLGPKGNLKFLLDQPLPLELIARVIKRLAERGAAPAIPGTRSAASTPIR